MATTINFPSSPSIDDTYLYETITYTWNGTYWYVNKLFNLPTDSVGIPNLKNILKNTSIPITTIATNTNGDQIYTTPGTFSWVCPAGVTSISVLAIGGGGGGSQYSSYAMGGAGGGLGWKNNITVIPGNSYTVVVGIGGTKGAYGFNASVSGGDSYFINATTVKGGGGIGGAYNTIQTTGGTYIGDGGGNGGYGPIVNTSAYANAGSGAGGYSGAGGNAPSTTNTAGNPGIGGAGGSGGNAGSSTTSSGGGGVGIFGQGANGTGGLGSTSNATTGGGGGSGGTDGGIFSTATIFARGGLYGGGGGGSDTSSNYNGDGGSGAVRIIWGPGRSFPSTQVSTTGVYTSKILEIDWSLGIQCEPIVLTMDTEITFTGYISGQTLTLEISGDYVLTLPLGVDAAISSSYDGTVTNYIQLYCVDSTTPKFLAGIIL